MNRACQALCQGWGYKSEQKQTRPCPRGAYSLHITKVRGRKLIKHVLYFLYCQERLGTVSHFDLAT